MKFLILHIICAVLGGINAVISTNMTVEILNIISIIMWSIMAGMDIVELIHKD